MTEVQFVTCIWVAIGKGWRISAKEALPIARQAYHEFMMDIGYLPFGHASYAWDESSAQVIAEEYALRFGEAA
jgi:hypothetical protein